MVYDHHILYTTNAFTIELRVAARVPRRRFMRMGQVNVIPNYERNGCRLVITAFAQFLLVPVLIVKFEGWS